MVWPVMPLGDACEFENGDRGKNYPSRAKFVDSGIAFINAGHIDDGRIDFSTMNYISDETFSLLSRGKIQVGDVLFCLRGSLGKFAIVDKDTQGAIASSLVIIRPQNLSAEFLAYYLRSRLCQKEIEKYAAGAAQPNLGAKDLAKFEIPLPPIPEQQRIVTILDQAFADIEKARANAEQNLKNARELFDSYLQQVSTEKKPLGNFVTIKTGKLNANAAIEKGTYPFFTCSREVFAIDNYSFDCEAILLAGNNASGDFNVKHYKGKFNAYQRTYVITISDTSSLLYPFLYYQMLKSLKELKQSSVGAGTKFLKIDMIKDLEISIPSSEEQQRTLDVLEPLKTNIEKLETNYKEKLASLNDLKKSLLQKAFSGELTKSKGIAA